MSVRSTVVGGGERLVRSRRARSDAPYQFGFWQKRAEIGEEFFEVFAGEAPFNCDVGDVGAGAWFSGEVMVEALLDDGDDLFGCWVFAWGVDEAAITEGFEVRNFAGGVEGGEFGEGFGEGEEHGVEDFGGPGRCGGKGSAVYRK